MKNLKKYRGRVMGKDFWVRGYAARNPSQEKCYIEYGGFNFKVDPDSLEEMSGICDKKGCEIGENDVLRFQDRLCKVRYFEELGRWGCTIIEQFGHDPDFAELEKGAPYNWPKYAEVVL